MVSVLDRMRGGAPLPYFLNLRAEAEDWARFASRAELRAYAVASLAGMSPDGRVAVLRRFHSGGVA